MSQTDNIDILHQAIEAEDLSRLKVLLEGLHSSEIANVIEGMTRDQRIIVWGLINPKIQGEVLSEVNHEVRNMLLEHIPHQNLIDVTSDMETDDVVDILQDLPVKVVDSILESMDEQNRQRLASVLTYPENTAAGLMNTDIITVSVNVSLNTVIRYLRRIGHIPEKTDNLMVVDKKNRYLGTLSLTELLVRPPDSTVGEWINRDIAVQSDTLKDEVARLFQQRDLISVAVVNDNQILLGRITVDDVVDVIQKNADDKFLGIAGMGEEDLFSSVISSTRRRAVWLGVNLLTAFLAAWVIGRFEETIKALVSLAILMPVVAGMGGIAGSQTLTIVVRGIALGQIGKKNLKALLRKELQIGALSGVIWALVIVSIVFLWLDDIGLAIIIGLAILFNFIVATVSGTLIPSILKYYNIDPAIAGNVILTTATDIIGFVTFLGLASLFLI